MESIAIEILWKKMQVVHAQLEQLPNAEKAFLRESILELDRAVERAAAIIEVEKIKREKIRQE